MNLFSIQDSSIISKTSLSRKLTIGGITKAYPVYRVRIDQLYYNDQNDRIATWITQYKNDVDNISFSELSREEYNKIIEKFIIDSNPAAIEKTKRNNLSLSETSESIRESTKGSAQDKQPQKTVLKTLLRVMQTIIRLPEYLLFTLAVSNCSIPTGRPQSQSSLV